MPGVPGVQVQLGAATKAGLFLEVLELFGSQPRATSFGQCDEVGDQDGSLFHGLASAKAPRSANGQVLPRLPASENRSPLANTTNRLYISRVSETDEDQADALFHALSDRTRRDIMRRVLAGEHSVSALAAKYDMSFAAVQKHVAVLEKSGLLVKRRSGREQLARGDVEAVRAVSSMLVELEQVWRGRIARIDELIATQPQRKE
jgi:DNA-binding transcriptional ArsR family regulator